MSSLIIAEAGVNHNGSLDRAIEMIEVAAIAGADVVKFQTFKSEQVLSRNAPKAPYQQKYTLKSESQLEMAQKLELDETQHMALVERCRNRGIEFMSSPFDLYSVDFLTSVLNVPRVKIASGEITNFPLLLKVAQTQKPIILSTGMSNLGEVEAALGVLAFGYLSPENPPSEYRAFFKTLQSSKGQRVLREKVTLLHCTTEYPAPFEDVNLKAIDTLKAAFSLPTGLSDHTLGIAVSIAAAARGAAVIEKHFTLDPELPGPDHKASLDPESLIQLVRSIREVESAMGTGFKVVAESESKNLDVARKSLVAARKISKGERFNQNNLTTKRPGSGVSATRYWQYLGMTSRRDYEEDELIDD
jgi:N-acetylneuraminate synthase